MLNYFSESFNAFQLIAPPLNFLRNPIGQEELEKDAAKAIVDEVRKKNEITRMRQQGPISMTSAGAQQKHQQRSLPALQVVDIEIAPDVLKALEESEQAL